MHNMIPQRTLSLFPLSISLSLSPIIKIDHIIIIIIVIATSAILWRSSRIVLSKSHRIVSYYLTHIVSYRFESYRIVSFRIVSYRIALPKSCRIVSYRIVSYRRQSFGLKRREINVRQSADGRVTSDDYRVTVQRLYWKFCHLAWNAKKKLFDSRPTVAWPPTTFAWPFRVFFENFAIWLETSRISCLTVGRWSRDLRRLSSDRSATFLKICHLAWNVKKKLLDSRPTVAWPPTTIAWPFSDFFENFAIWLETSIKSCLTVDRRSRDLRRLSRDRSATFLKILQFGLKHREKVVWQSADGRVTSDDYRVTVSSTFLKILPFGLKRREKVVWQSADGRVTSDDYRVTVQRLFSKFCYLAWNVEKKLFGSRPTVAWPPTTIAWPFSAFFLKFCHLAWNVEKKLFDSRPTVAWPPTTIAWPFSDFFQNFAICSNWNCLTVGRRSRDLRRLSCNWLLSDFQSVFDSIRPN